MTKSAVNKRGRIVVVENTKPTGYAIDSMTDPITRRVYVSVSKIGISPPPPPQYSSFLLDKENNIIWSFNNKLSRQTGQVVISGGFVPKDENGNEVIATHIAQDYNTIYVSTLDQKVRFYDFLGVPIQKNNRYYIQCNKEITCLHSLNNYILAIGYQDGTVDGYKPNWSLDTIKFGQPSLEKTANDDSGAFSARYFLADLNQKIVASIGTRKEWSGSAYYYTTYIINSDGETFSEGVDRPYGFAIQKPPFCYFNFQFRKMYFGGEIANKGFCHYLSEDGLKLIENVDIPPVSYGFTGINYGYLPCRKRRRISIRRDETGPANCQCVINIAYEAGNALQPIEWDDVTRESLYPFFRVEGQSINTSSGHRDYGDAYESKLHFTNLSTITPDPNFAVKEILRVKNLKVSFNIRDYLIPNGEFIFSPENKIFYFKDSVPEKIFQSGAEPSSEIIFKLYNYNQPFIFLYCGEWVWNGFGAIGVYYHRNFGYGIQWIDYVIYNLNEPTTGIVILLDREYDDFSIHPWDF